MFIGVKGIHSYMNTATTNGWNQVFCGVPNKDKTTDMTVGFHRSSEGLLGYLGKGIAVINNNPTIGFFAIICVQGHLPNKHGHMPPNGLDTTVLIRCEQ